jgi:hypothetical protein
MKKGFSKSEVRRYFFGLRNEIFTFYNFEPESPVPLVWNDPIPWDHDYMYVEYGDDLSTPQYMSINEAVLPFLYEDELIGMLLHEWAHVVAGWAAAHGPVWSQTSALVGGHSGELIQLRGAQEYWNAQNPVFRMYVNPPRYDLMAPTYGWL